MGLCPGCGKSIRDDIWVCGYCGELVAGNGAANGAGPCAATAAYSGTASMGAPAGGGSASAGYPDGGPGAPAPAPLPTSSTSSRTSSGSHAVLLASVLGVIAVVAIVAVWFFVLRGGGGDFSAYVGEWQLTVPGSTAGLSMAIQDGDGNPQMMMGSTATYAGQTAAQAVGPYKMELEDGNLITRLEATKDAGEEQKVAAEAARAALGAVVDDFKMVFAPGGTPDTLSLTMEGDIQGGGLFAGDVSSQALILTRVPGTTSTL
jgi:hypothetical protein